MCAHPCMFKLTCSKMIFVFNKHYLDYDMDEVMKHLRVEPPLQPSIEGTPPSLAQH